MRREVRGERWALRLLEWMNEVSSRVSVLCGELWLATKDRRAVYNVARSED